MPVDKVHNSVLTIVNNSRKKRELFFLSHRMEAFFFNGSLHSEDKRFTASLTHLFFLKFLTEKIVTQY